MCAFNFVLKGVLLVISGIACIAWSLACIALIITSPIWGTVWALRDPEACAIRLNESNDYVKGRLASYIKWCTWAMCRASLWLCTPIIAILPMRYHKEFILAGKKALADYSVKTQVAYYKTFTREGQVNLLSGGQLSQAAIDAIWQDEAERAKCIDAGWHMTEGVVRELCKGENSALLWRYFKKNTPNKTMSNILIEMAHQGYATPQSVLLNLIKQQRPDANLLNKLMWFDNRRFKELVRNTMDEYADLDAVTYASASAEDIAQHWTNFCKGKKEISSKAQQKMGYEHYLIYAETGHTLEYNALRYLLANIADKDYLKAVVENEFDKLDDMMLTILKAEYWRYSVYLAVKEARTHQNAAA